ncbi:membrane-anchored protein [Agrobacterium rubi]|uniref:membrane-anchored protein n=1 Tax=Agrobacterium rubi TaxID=28099 RepID=UPI00157220CF|nr:membrane-anchored protein [Agrobacterium rubi]NTF08092.1 membrane-anchored protein [Agrobacterium rubi]NTF20320.1 membrane-anchored protein [Agrobacterium rubi]NTF27291.1 membrane-anchored protein [Agrobacterium rubi]
MKSLKHLKTLIFRSLSYYVSRPQPWSDPSLKGRKVVVVGSAPHSSMPVGFDRSYVTISINASQIVAKKWGVEKPDMTLMMFNQIEGTNTNAKEVRRVLNGERTGTLYVLLWQHSVRRLKAGLGRFDYMYDDVRVADRNRRVALVYAMTGKMNFEIDPHTKFSNGVIGVMLALQSGAEAVVIAGINPTSTGHIYNTENLRRNHSGPDLDALKGMQKKGLPVYTADPEVAEATGLPIWTGGR